MNAWEKLTQWYATRDLKEKAAVLADEALRRKRVKPVMEGVQGFVDSGAWERVREQVLGAAMNTNPSPEVGLDAAGAYWFRRGLEQAIQSLDGLIAAAAEGDVE